MRPLSPDPQISDQHPQTVVLRSPLSASDVLGRLGRASRLGRLPGYAPRGAAAFSVEADALPFVHELVGAIEERAGEGSVVRLSMRRVGRMPLLFAAVIALTIWPGVWLTDSLMATYWSAYGRWSQEMPWLTYAWYMPITVLPLPWAWRSMSRKSRAEAAESGRKQVVAIAEAIEGTAA